MIDNIVMTVAEGPEPITTMGGLRVIPGLLLADLDPQASDLLVLAGGTMWDTAGGQAGAGQVALPPAGAAGRRRP
jgi:hypothetical protein